MNIPIRFPAARDGFTLIEVVVAIVLLSTVLVSLGGLSYHAARQAINVGNGAGRQAVTLEAVNALSSMPWDSLPKDTYQCDTTQHGGSANRYLRCVRVSPAADRQVTVTLVVRPLQPGSFRDSLVFLRSAPAGTNPLWTP